MNTIGIDHRDQLGLLALAAKADGEAAENGTPSVDWELVSHNMALFSLVPDPSTVFTAEKCATYFSELTKVTGGQAPLIPEFRPSTRGVRTGSEPAFGMASTDSVFTKAARKRHMDDLNRSIRKEEIEFKRPFWVAPPFYSLFDRVSGTDRTAVACQAHCILKFHTHLF